MSLRQWKCTVCTTTYSRLEHLRRHLRSHEDRRPFECEYCARAFTRRDVMRRHERTCKAQGHFSASRGMTPAASHSQGHNSGRLQENTVTESIPQTDILANIPPCLDFSALDWLYWPQGTSDNVSVTESLEYLEYFTSANGMRTFLDRDTLKQRQKLVLEAEADLDVHRLYTNDDRDESDWGAPWSLDLACTDAEYLMPDTSIISTLDPLCPVTREIIQQIQSTIASNQDKNITLEWDESVQHSCDLFFTPANIRRFVEYFWALWYPNCPIVHRPSFDPQTASPTLVCVMVIIGACLSPHEEDGRLARMWLDCAEEMVFAHDLFREKSGGKVTLETIKDRHQGTSRLECIQMTYLVCSLQKREGSMDAQARIRRHRHAAMVTMAREIGLGTATHRSLRLDRPSSEWWEQYSTEEELIRALTYVFLFDAALTIFHNSPPRMVVSELKLEMAYPEACFQAGSADECFSALKQWEDSIFWRGRLSVTAVVRKICQRELDTSLAQEFARMGTLNMFTTVQALHSLTFHLQNSIIFETTLTPVQTGLENWRRVWNERQPEDRDIPNQADTIWKKVGFTCYAPEFWQLARIIVAQIQSDSADDEREHHPAPEQGTNRYDHTDMTDVNGLIMEYRRMNLGAAPAT